MSIFIVVCNPVLVPWFRIMHLEYNMFNVLSNKKYQVNFQGFWTTPVNYYMYEGCP